MSASFKVSVINVAGAPALLTGFPSLVTTAVTAPENAPELPGAKYLHLNDYRYFNSAGSFVTPVYKTDTMFKGQILDMDLVGTAGTSPVLPWYYRL